MRIIGQVFVFLVTKVFGPIALGVTRLALALGLPGWVAGMLGELTAVGLPWLIFFVLPIMALVALSGCDAAPARVCIPGESRLCVCPGGSTSAQVCSDDGTRLGACACGPIADGGGDAAALPDAIVVPDSSLDRDGGVVVDDLGLDAADDDAMPPLDGGVDVDTGPGLSCSHADETLYDDGVTCASSQTFDDDRGCAGRGGTVLQWGDVMEEHAWIAFLAAHPEVAGAPTIGAPPMQGGMTALSLGGGRWQWPDGSAPTVIDWATGMPPNPSFGYTASRLDGFGLHGAYGPGYGPYLCVRAAP